MKKYIFLILVLIVGSLNGAWLTPRPVSQFVASMDVLAVSSDSASVGSEGDLWKNVYQRNSYLKYRNDKPDTLVSYGTVYASTDNNLYFQDANGVNTKLN